MDLDNFKREFASELSGLTPARISTLWKKSKTLTHAELLDAINNSKIAQAKDKQRRGKDADNAQSDHISQVIQSNSVTAAPVEVATCAPVEVATCAPVEVATCAPVEVAQIDTIPDWSKVCSHVGVDHMELQSIVRNLRDKIDTRALPLAVRTMRKDQLNAEINNLLQLRERFGTAVDVLCVLSQQL